MRILSWNIQAGGGSRVERIVERIQQEKPDVLVLSEIRANSLPLLNRLSTIGWGYWIARPPRAKCGGLAILSRDTLELGPAFPREDLFPARWLEVTLPRAGFSIVGVYGTLQNEDYNRFWNTAVPLLKERVNAPVLITGDLNTGKGLLDAPKKNFFCSKYFTAIEDAGFTDIWRQRNPEAREFSYYHRGNKGSDPTGYRLDHALVSKPLSGRVRACTYLHDAREQRVSDHAPLIIDVEAPALLNAALSF
jgi:exodeoxyribonuclease-3